VDAEITTQTRFYRRGTVLGFTMAEIVVLIIFALLLAQAAILKHKDQRIVELTGTNAAQEKRIVELSNESKALRIQVSNTNQFDDVFHVLRVTQQKLAEAQRQVVALEEQATARELRAQQEMAAAQQRAADLAALAKTMEPLMTHLASAKMTSASTDEKVAWVSERIELAQAAIQLVQESGLRSDSAQLTLAEFKKLLPSLQSVNQTLAQLQQTARHNTALQEQLHQAELQNATLQGQLRHLQQMGKGMGKGTEKPACWASRDTGNPEYIFDVALTSTGMIVRDNALAHRHEEQQRLPLQSMVFNTELSPKRFLSDSSPLFKWSNNKDPACRFFVRVFDLTRASEKNTYKQHLRTVGQHFYSYEVLHAKF
jgi:hypothetical protein